MGEGVQGGVREPAEEPRPWEGAPGPRCLAVWASHPSAQCWGQIVLGP